MICRVCLLESTEYMDIFGTVGVELGIASIISKYFWFEPKIDDPISSIICNTCWRKLDSFHLFYTTVEDAHSQLSERLFVKEEPDIKKASSNMRLDFAVVDEEGDILNISEPDNFNNAWSPQISLGSEDVGCISTDEEMMHIEKPLKEEKTNKVYVYSSTDEEDTNPSTSTELEEMSKDKGCEIVRYVHQPERSLQCSCCDKALKRPSFRTMPKQKRYLRCILKSCNSSSISNPNMRFSSFPKYGSKRFYEWCKVTNLELGPGSHYLCHAHFRESDIINIRLSKFAVPSRNLEPYFPDGEQLKVNKDGGNTYARSNKQSQMISSYNG